MESIDSENDAGERIKTVSYPSGSGYNNEVVLWSNGQIGVSGIWIDGQLLYDILTKWGFTSTKGESPAARLNRLSVEQLQKRMESGNDA